MATSFQLIPASPAESPGALHPGCVRLLTSKGENTQDVREQGDSLIPQLGAQHVSRVSSSLPFTLLGGSSSQGASSELVRDEIRLDSDLPDHANLNLLLSQFPGISMGINDFHTGDLSSPREAQLYQITAFRWLPCQRSSAMCLR